MHNYSSDYIHVLAKKEATRKTVAKFIADFREFIIRTRQAGWGSYELVSRGHRSIRVYHDIQRKVSGVAFCPIWRIPQYLADRWGQVRSEKETILTALKDLKVASIFEHAPCGDCGPFYLQICFWDASERPMDPILYNILRKNRIKEKNT